jgi:hypothetical protein
MVLDKNFKEFIELLNEHKVKYLIIDSDFRGFDPPHQCLDWHQFQPEESGK